METETEVAHAETIKELAKKPQRWETKRKHVETALCEQIQELGNNDFQKAQEVWKIMIAQAVHAQLLLMTTFKKCEMWYKKTKGWVFEQ